MSSAPRPVALVTGAGRRVGRAIAEGLGAKGMHVIVHHHSSPDGARETAATIEREGGQATIVTADLRDTRAAESLIDQVTKEAGRLDVLVNSASLMLRTPLGEVTAAQWDDIFALNVRAPFFLSQRAAPALASVAGCIVNIADLAAFETWPAYIPHGMTKAALVQMTRGLARALAPSVRVNAVAPGVVLLPEGWSEDDAERLRATTPLARSGSPQDVVDAVLYLLAAKFVTGEVITVDGGRHVRT